MKTLHTRPHLEKEAKGNPKWLIGYFTVCLHNIGEIEPKDTSSKKGFRSTVATPAIKNTRGK